MDTERTLTTDLTRWERYYLEHARHGSWVQIPTRNPKVADSLIDKGLIETLGFEMGKYIDFNLTPYGRQVYKQLTATAGDPAAGDG